MLIIVRAFFRSRGLLLMAAALTIVSLLGSIPATAAPARAPLAATLPATTCSLTGTTRTCHLYAKTGTLTLPAGSVPASVTIWGYADTAGGAASLPGPMLIVNQGETVQVTLHNTLVEASSLAFPGQTLTADTTGVASGGIKTYSFVASRPGTYLYEAGLTADGQVQVAMGLFGALIVRPTACLNCAYGASSAYNDEALVVLSEIDPAFNAAPATFNLRNYAPKYWLINGKAYPDTAPISVAAAGDKVLFRYVNAGLEHHSAGLLGLRQAVLATDGKPLPFTYQAVAETIPAGATLDTLATIPASAAVGTKYALYSASKHLDNNGARSGGIINFGGMLTFLTVASGGPSPTNTPTPTPTNTPTPIPTNTPTPTPTNTPIPSTMHIGDLDGTSANIDATRWRATVTITVHDANHNLVASATATGTWSAGDGNGRTLSCITNASGQCNVTSGRLSRTNNASVVFTVTNVTKATFTYQSTANHDPDGDSNGTAITVARPAALRSR